jgi:uncharacterized protein YjlB
MSRSRAFGAWNWARIISLIPARREVASMYAREILKKNFERLTGIGRPAARSARATVRSRKPRTAFFSDDGVIPNNRKLPFIHYRSPVRLTDVGDPAALFEVLFKQNGWRDSWRDGIYDYPHYHSSTHEVLGIARGHARVRFGGDNGKIVDLKAGDVAILPAGTGHQRLSASKDLLVVGAYPPRGKYDECEGSAAEHARAVKSIPAVPLPSKDPVYGADGPLLDLWSD